MRNTVLKFSAPWCAPCKQLAPIFEEVISTFGDTIESTEFDVDVNEGVCQKYGVRSIPTIIVVDSNGAILDKKVGAITKEDLQIWLKNYA